MAKDSHLEGKEHLKIQQELHLAVNKHSTFKKIIILHYNIIACQDERKRVWMGKGRQHSATRVVMTTPFQAGFDIR